MKKAFKVFLFIESSRASGRHLLEGIARYAHHHGPWSFYWEPRGLEAGRATLKELDADGIIFRDVGRFKEEVLRLRIPAVVVGHAAHEVRGLINVVTDSATIGRMAAEHLLQCGFKRFAFCGYAGTELEQTPWSQERQEAFQRRIVAAGHPPPAAYVLPSQETDWKKSRQRLANWLAALPTPLGLMACNDDCAVQVIEACKLAGLTVPDAVGIVGVDNDEVVCGLSDPPLTSIAVNFERAGYEAAQALEKLMRRGKPRAGRIHVPATHLVARRSTDVVAVEDPFLAKALRFIRDNARRAVSVGEVVQQAGLSRRLLERRFRREMGHSILSEIRRARCDEIARLLMETNWSISRIAEALGFGDEHHIARYFRAGKKITPLAFRKLQAAQPADR
ncbi:MAG TPA: DNA-binding transcriptional regulator [Verrucomicrobiae bacterium]|nr:DNA-binding transcriptional regulator [Verrucomicrobiae bacterium]